MKYTPFILILVFSCVEHKFSLTVSPDGSYQVEYTAHGDKKDLKDLDFSLPIGEGWIINTTMENTEADSYDYTARRVFKRNEPFPATFYKGDSIYFESLLKHPIEVKHSNWFFWETYTFQGRFMGRMVESKYPLIGQLIKNMEDPPKGWIKEALEYLLNETLNQSDIEWNTLPIINTGLQNWFDTELQIISDSTLFEEIDYYKNLGLDIIMQPASPSLYNNMDSIFKSLEDELQITLDLMDDSFSFQLNLQGVLQKTNADSLAGDTLFWSFQLEDFMHEDYILTAQSGIGYPERQKKGVFILVVCIVLLILKITMRKKEAKKE